MRQTVGEKQTPLMDARSYRTISGSDSVRAAISDIDKVNDVLVSLGLESFEDRISLKKREKVEGCLGSQLKRGVYSTSIRDIWIRLACLKAFQHLDQISRDFNSYGN